MDKSVNLKSGDKIVVESGDVIYLACCDCFLVHQIKATSIGKEISLVVKRDNYRTKRDRMKNNITIKKVYE